MIYILYSASGSYDEYCETAEYYFTNKSDAEKVLEKLLNFDKHIAERGLHLDYWKVRKIYEVAYKKIGFTAYIDDGISWFIRPVKCGNTLECLR